MSIGPPAPIKRRVRLENQKAAAAPSARRRAVLLRRDLVERRRALGRGRRGEELARRRADGHVRVGRLEHLVPARREERVEVVVRQRPVPLLHLALPPAHLDLLGRLRDVVVERAGAERAEAHPAHRRRLRVDRPHRRGADVGVPVQRRRARAASRDVDGRLVPARLLRGRCAERRPPPRARRARACLGYECSGLRGVSRSTRGDATQRQGRRHESESRSSGCVFRIWAKRTVPCAGGARAAGSRCLVPAVAARRRRVDVPHAPRGWRAIPAAAAVRTAPRGWRAVPAAAAVRAAAGRGGRVPLAAYGVRHGVKSRS